MNINDSSKTILCYGDSNTWGNVPRSDARYPKSVRWPGALQERLGDDYEVISEGLCGRTFVALDRDKPWRTGIAALQAILDSADPIDLVIVMLGTNDVKTTYGLSADDIAEHLEQTIKLITDPKVDLEKTPKILIICPTPVIEPKVTSKSAIGQELDKRMVRGPELFKVLPGLYEGIAQRYGCSFLNAGDIISSSEVDGYHLDRESHLKLAAAIKEKIAEMGI